MGLLEGRRESEECGTALQEVTDRTREPWRCDGCNQLMFILFPKEKLVGAPAPKFGTHEYPKLCSLCFGVICAIRDSVYWKSIHDVWKSRQAENKRLKPGENYFA